MTGYFYHLGVFMAVYALLAFGLNVILGYCGRLSLAHVVFFAIGAYGYAYGSIHLDAGLLFGLACSTVLALPLVVLYTMLTHSRHGDEYVLMSLAFQAMANSVMSNWYDASRKFGTIGSFTNGPFGVSGIPRPPWLSDAGVRLSLTTTLVASLSVVLVAWLLKGSWGRSLRAMRDDEPGLAGLGRDVFGLHLEATLLGSVLAAIAGGIYALYVGYVDPQLSSLDQAVLVLSMLIVGGMGNVRGPLLGSFLLIALPEVLRFIPGAQLKIDNLRVMIFGAALVVLIHFRPQGLVGSYSLGSTSESDRGGQR